MGRVTAGQAKASLPVHTYVHTHTGCQRELPHVFTLGEHLPRAISLSLHSPIIASGGLLKNICKKVFILLPL